MKQHRLGKLVSGAKYKDYCALNNLEFPIQSHGFMPPMDTQTTNDNDSEKLSSSSNDTGHFSPHAQQPSFIEHAQLPQKPAVSRAKCTVVEDDSSPFRSTLPCDKLDQFATPYRIIRLLEDAHHIPVKEVLQRYQAKFGRELGIELGDPNASEEEMTNLLRPALPPRLRIIQHLCHFYVAAHPPHPPPYHITRHYPPRLATLRNRILRLCSHPVDIATLECMYEHVFEKIEWPMKVWVERGWQPAIKNWEELMKLIVENLGGRVLKPELKVELLWKDLDGRNVKVPPIFADEDNVTGRIKCGPLFERILNGNDWMPEAPKILEYNADSGGIENLDIDGPPRHSDVIDCTMEANDYFVIRATRTHTFKSSGHSNPPEHPKTYVHKQWTRDGYTPRYTQPSHGVDTVHAVNVAKARQTMDENKGMFSGKKVDSRSGNTEFFSLKSAELGAVGQRTPRITTAANTAFSSSPMGIKSLHNNTTIPDRMLPTCSSTWLPLRSNPISGLSSDSSATPLTPQRSPWFNSWTLATKSTPLVELTPWSEDSLRSPIRFPLINPRLARRHTSYVKPGPESASANSIPLATLQPELSQPVVILQPKLFEPAVTLQPELLQPVVNHHCAPASAKFIPSDDSAKGLRSLRPFRPWQKPLRSWQDKRYFTRYPNVSCFDKIAARKQAKKEQATWVPASVATPIDWNFIPLDDNANGPCSRSWRSDIYRLRKPRALTKRVNANTIPNKKESEEEREERMARKRKGKDKEVAEKRVRILGEKDERANKKMWRSKRRRMN